MDPYEVHVLNNDADLNRLREDWRIPNSAQVLLMQRDVARKLAAEVLAAADSGAHIIALAVNG